MAGIFGYVPNNTLGALYLTPQTGNEAIWRQALANQGSISKPRPSLGGRLENATVDTLRKAGVSDRTAARLGSKTFSAINDLTPVGNATMAADAGDKFRTGHPFKGLGLGALAVLPGAVRKAGMFGRPVIDSLGRDLGHSTKEVESFWNWFDGSKAVDDEGRPLALYHATRATFDKFRNSWRGATYHAFSPDGATRGARAGELDLYATPGAKPPMRVLDVYARVPSVSGLNPSSAVQTELRRFPAELTDDEATGIVGDAIERAGLLREYRPHFTGPPSKETYRLGQYPHKPMLDAVRDRLDYRGSMLPGYQDIGEREHVAKMLQRGFDGSLVQDEAGVSLSVYNPENLWIRPK